MRKNFTSFLNIKFSAKEENDSVGLENKTNRVFREFFNLSEKEQKALNK